MNGSSRRSDARPERHRALARPEDRRALARPEELTALLEPVVSAAGLELESVRVSRAGSRRLLRVVVDGDDGVDMDDIARVSRTVAAEVDDRDAMGSGGYTLEVSSPGVDRPLTEARHWRRARGRLVRVTVKDFGPGTTDASAPPSNGERAVDGRVVAATSDAVTLDIDGTKHEISYADLGPGQVQVEFGGRYGDLGGPATGDEDLAASAVDGGEPDGH
jgi:ribosome maturation factor RimP